MSDLRIIFSHWSPFYQAISVLIVAMFAILLMGVLDSVVPRVTSYLRIRRARRYFNQVVRVEQRDLTRKRLELAARAGVRS